MVYYKYELETKLHNMEHADKYFSLVAVWAVIGFSYYISDGEVFCPIATA